MPENKVKYHRRDYAEYAWPEHVQVTREDSLFLYTTHEQGRCIFRFLEYRSYLLMNKSWQVSKRRVPFLVCSV